MREYIPSIKYYIVFTVALFLTSFIGGIYVAQSYPGMAEEVVGNPDIFGQLLSEASSFGLFMLIFLNNSIKIFIALVLGITFGIAPMMFVIANGYILGIVAYLVHSNLNWDVFLLSIAPHGIIEIPVFIVGSALGIMIGADVFKWFFTKKSANIKSNMRYGINIFFKALLPLFLFAAFVEVFVTPFVIEVMVKGVLGY